MKRCVTFLLHYGRLSVTLTNMCACCCCGLPSQEVKATETIQKLKNEIAQLSRLVEKSAGLVGQGNTVEELLKVC